MFFRPFESLFRGGLPPRYGFSPALLLAFCRRAHQASRGVKPRRVNKLASFGQVAVILMWRDLVVARRDAMSTAKVDPKDLGAKIEKAIEDWGRGLATNDRR